MGLSSGNLRNLAEVAEMITGIQNGLETYQLWFVGVTGHNSIPPIKDLAPRS